MKTYIINNRFLSFPGVFIIILTLFSCAQMATPEGGPKDITPPHDSTAVPQNYTTHFKAEKVKIRFSEFIRLENVNKELTVSPYMKDKPDVQVRGKHLLIHFKDSLQKNTTYTLDFGNAIADITEGNVDKNFRYVFSTGKTIDSLFIKGKVLDAYSHEPEADMWVMLYTGNVDSLPRTTHPEFLTKTDKQGDFSLLHLPKGKYKIFALKDNNYNQKFDLPNEKIAFLNKMIPATHNDSNVIILNAFTENHEKQYIKTIKAPDHDEIRLILNLPAKSVALQAINYNNPDWYLKQSSKQNDTTDFWLKPTLKTDSITFKVLVNDMVMDTTHLKIPPVSKAFRLKIGTNLNGHFLPPTNQLILNANRPVSSFDTTHIKLMEDSTPIAFQLNRKDDFGKFILQYGWQKDKVYHLNILPKAFTDIQGQYNIDTVKYIFKTADMESFSTLKVELQLQEKGHYLLELLRGKNSIKTYHLSASGTFSFTSLPPGAYKLRLIKDENNNGKWDTGNYKLHKQAEPVLIYKGELNMKANWDQSIKWKCAL